MQDMKRLLLVLILLHPVPGFAMNWEGHDDWMEDQAEALAYAASVPHAVPLAPDDCQPPSPVNQSNPYEQVPLGKSQCRAVPETPNPDQ